jgi:hypothetical protein
VAVAGGHQGDELGALAVREVLERPLRKIARRPILSHGRDMSRHRGRGCVAREHLSSIRETQDHPRSSTLPRTAYEQDARLGHSSLTVHDSASFRRCVRQRPRVAPLPTSVRQESLDKEDAM